MNTVSPLGALILLGVLFFIVYRLVQALIGAQEQVLKEERGKAPRRPAPPAPPEKIDLAPITDEEENPLEGGEEMDDIHQVLAEQNGMSLVGDFTIERMPGYAIRAYTHPEFSLVGVVYLAPGGETWTSLITRYSDGRVITSSSANREVNAPPRPRGMPLFNYPHLRIDQLFRRHKLEVREAEKDGPIPPEEFTEFFAENYKKLQQAAAGEDRTSAIAALPAEGGEREAAAAPSPAELREWLDKIYSAYPVPKEKRRQFQKGLVWVAEDAGMGSISRTIARYTGARLDEVERGRWVIRTESGVEDIVEEGALKGPALFEKINACLPAGKKFTRLPVSVEGVAFYNRMAQAES
ncbi:MAG: hypothetical protein ACNS63_01555 [Candidatus Nitrospinota bacterium M3_3B_026]